MELKWCRRNIPAKKKRVVKVTAKTMSKRIPMRQASTRTFFLTEPTSPLRSRTNQRQSTVFWSVSGLNQQFLGHFRHNSITYNPCSEAPGVASGFSKSMAWNRLTFLNRSRHDWPFVTFPISNLSASFALS